MEKAIDEAVQIIEKFIPKKIGIKKSLYKIDGDELELVFVIEEKQAALVMTYIKTVSTIIERELNMKIQTSLYIEAPEKDFNLLKASGHYLDLIIPNKELREIAMAC